MEEGENVLSMNAMFCHVSAYLLSMYLRKFCKDYCKERIQENNYFTLCPDKQASMHAYEKAHAHTHKSYTLCFYRDDELKKWKQRKKGGLFML